MRPCRHFCTCRFDFDYSLAPVFITRLVVTCHSPVLLCAKLSRTDDIAARSATNDGSGNAAAAAAATTGDTFCTYARTLSLEI